jgi:hypothetical protein
MHAKWKDYEKALAALHAAFLGECEVEHDVRLRGRAGESRQIDIAIRHKLGPYPLLTIVDAKDYKDPVDRGCVAAFAELRRDVMANTGVMIAPNGFTSGAKAVAADENIYLRESYSSEKEPWSANLRLPVCVDCSFLLYWTTPSESLNFTVDGKEIDLAWKAGELPFKEGKYLTQTYPFPKSVGGPVELAIMPQRKIKFANLPLNFLGILSTDGDEVLTHEITTGNISIYDVLNWPETAPDDCPRIPLVLNFVAPAAVEGKNLSVAIPGDMQLAMSFKTVKAPITLARPKG